jgi:ribose 5-phosphate isomerase RpiB
MIFTARQIEDLHKANGHVQLPVGARLSPLASDWLRKKKVAVVYGDRQSVKEKESATPSRLTVATPSIGATLWWCDGPCGQAKAALAAQARETNLQPMPIGTEPKHVVAAVKHLAGEIKADRASAGVLIVQTGAAAMVYANRCPSLRAVLGTCRDAVQQGVGQLAANVLVIEHPYQSLPQVRNLLTAFVRGQRELNDDVKQQLKDLASCG